MSREIPLSRGMVAIVDDQDYEWLTQWKWHAHKSRSLWYACRYEKIDGKYRTIRMHRVIIDAPDGVIVDHINRDSLDNRRSNLRLSTHRDNFYNSVWFENEGWTSVEERDKRKRKKGKRVTGSMRKRHGTWQVTLTISRLDDECDAEQARDELVSLARRIIQ